MSSVPTIVFEFILINLEKGCSKKFPRKIFEICTRSQRWLGDRVTFFVIIDDSLLFIRFSRSDGARFAVANLTGGTFLFNCSLKKSSMKGKYAINFVSLSQVSIENKSAGKRTDLISRNGFEIVDVKILGRDRYAVGYTSHTLILVDLEDEKRRCEVHWQSAGDEKFSFDNENVCMIFANGELTLIEYAPSARHSDNILCTVRTEFLSPNLISVRVEERHSKGNKKLAYLLDSRTIAIVDLMSTSGAAVIDQVNHDANINWLALNETSRYLLFRDKNLKLYLYNLQSRLKTCILSFCIYAQWCVIFLFSSKIRKLRCL